jgi:hypothetical protein
MSTHVEGSDWADATEVVETVSAIAAGQLDTWSGRYLRAGADDLTRMRSVEPEGAERRLRLVPHGEGDTAR